jgi:phosphoribosylanthranilate isomerase
VSADVKICGLSTLETVDAALKGGARYIGLVFFAKSPRNLSLEQAASLSARAQGKAKVVGLFVDPAPDFLEAVRASVRLDVLQLHGEERPAQLAQIKSRHGLQLWKALPVQTLADVQSSARYVGSADLMLYDAKPPQGSNLPGGNGLRFDWRVLAGVQHRLPWGLAGGIDTRNVREAITITGAPLVDVSSGVESAPGIKDVDKIATFLKAVRDE